MDLINRNALVEEWTEKLSTLKANKNGRHYVSLETVIDELKRVPAVDAEPMKYIDADKLEKRLRYRFVIVENAEDETLAIGYNAGIKEALYILSNEKTFEAKPLQHEVKCDDCGYSSDRVVIIGEDAFCVKCGSLLKGEK